MTIRRLEYLQWFGFVAGGVTWFTLFITGNAVAVAACNPAGEQWHIPYDGAQLALLAFGLLTLVAAEAAAILVFRATGHLEDGDPPPEARMRFFAIGAMAGNALFFMIIVLSEVATVVARTCQQA